ncbi:MAG: Asp-tRNA(Asn)/Glu-tRNA(Gln) amidotransferase GatCAB subunit A, partial [Proteobacteria bacterium]|nr:Asp-tRNA(Asn)/Glu-tRNA(Gln) amidotransferase GatCAB subunit A [Pseudomonadota bacterium]
MSHLNELDIQALLSGYEKKQFTVSEVAESCLKAVAEKNPKLNALLEVSPEKVMKRAKELDSQSSSFGKLKLYGVPIAIKDNFLVKGWQCTA